MTNYLALIRKADFTDLFKYGKLHINNDMKSDFSCSVEDLPSHPEVFFNLTRFANSFDSAFAYLIIHYVKTSTKGLANDVNIEEVQNIYPLDFESKETFAMSFDERIRIENPIWPDSVWSLQKQLQFNDCLKGAANIREILGFSNSDQKCREIISDDIVREVVNELYEANRPSGELPIWVYLLRYERHSYYPQTTLGYFMDMVNVVCNRMGMSEVEEDNIKHTQIFMLLDSLRKNPEMQFQKIYQYLVDNPGAQGFFNKIDEFESRVDFSKVATLFLILRNRYKEDFVYEEDFITYCKNFGFEFELAAYLLGIVMGHQHTYDCMYDMLPLPIFKITSKTHITNKSGCGTLIDGASSDGNNSTETITQDPSNNSTPLIIPSKLGDSDNDNTQKSLEANDVSAQNLPEVKDTPPQEPSVAIDVNPQEPNIEKVYSAQDNNLEEDCSIDGHKNDSVESFSHVPENKNIIGNEEQKFPFKMRKPTGGRARTIKDENDYRKKYQKNLVEGFTEISYD